MPTKAELEKMLEESKAKNLELEGSQEELTKKIEEVQTESTEKENNFSSQMEEMKNMILQMQMTQMQSQTQQSVETHRVGMEETIAIRSNMIGPNHISIDRDSTHFFPEMGEIEDVLISDLQSILKFKNNKKLFVNGLLEFEDHDNYSVFRIKPRKILTDDYIIDLFLNKSKVEFIKELKAVTMDKKINSVVHNITHRAGLLYMHGKLSGVTWEIMDAFKTFFGIGLMELNIQLLED